MSSVFVSLLQCCRCACASSMSCASRTAHDAYPARDTPLTTPDEKLSRQPSPSFSDSLRSAVAPVANQEQHKDQHIATDNNVDGTTLEPVQSKHPSVRDASQIPNGGLWAWLQVVGGFFLLFNSWYVLRLSPAIPSIPHVRTLSRAVRLRDL